MSLFFKPLFLLLFTRYSFNISPCPFCRDALVFQLMEIWWKHDSLFLARTRARARQNKTDEKGRPRLTKIEGDKKEKQLIWQIRIEIKRLSHLQLQGRKTIW